MGTETLIVTATRSAYSSANVGTYSSTVTYTLANGTNGGLAANYTLASGTASGSITPRALTVTPSTINKSPSASLGWTPSISSNPSPPSNYTNTDVYSWYQEVTGFVGNGTGTDIYTANTPVGVAAVHTGLIAAGQTGFLKIIRLGSSQSYTGSTRNNITTSSGGWYIDSYRLELAYPSYSTTTGTQFSATGLVGGRPWDPSN